MLDFGFYNMDCMEGMKEFPDKYFDLAIVDPVFGDVTGGGYTTEKWDKQKPEGITFSDCELAFTSFNVGLRIFRFMWNGMLQGDMKNKEFRIHPTQKPVKLYEWLLNKYAKPDDIILDTHVGSGSSLIACHNTNHKYVGFEIDETYYKLAAERIKQETAQMNLFDFGI